MLIMVWLVTVVSLAIIIGECRYQYPKHTKKDVDIDFISMDALYESGSWRMRQSNILDKETFEKLRDEEYSKTL